MGQEVRSLKSELKRFADPKRAESSTWFFKTAPGQYGYGEVFLGVSVPNQRKVAKQFSHLSLKDIDILLKSNIHEYRLTSIFILVAKYNKANQLEKRKLYNFYLSHTKYVNNWDIVDSSAGYIVGEWLYTTHSSCDVLYTLAKSQSIWDRRIAIMATFAFIMHGESKITLKVAKILINDKHDLIQKAVGWMLREVGKRVDQKVEENFLLENNRYKNMPRTMLRYAIERFPEKRRKQFLYGTA